MTDLKDLIRWVNSDEAKTAAELHLAADVLGRHVKSRHPGLLEARVRVAVTLEKMGH